jgi:hypothetical protein
MENMALQALRHVHADLARLLDEMGVLTREPVPAMERLASIRHKLTRASRARYVLLEEIIPMLGRYATPEEAAELAALRSGTQADRVRSTGHISTWGSQQIARDWAGYCQASRALQLHMRIRIEGEAGLLYPMLGRLEVGRAA